jgi:galactokinase
VSGLAFLDLFGRAPQASAQAPGRVNLIGEHTDYNDGLVLPTTIPQQTRIEIARSPGDLVRAWSANVSVDGVLATYRLGQEQPRHAWIDFAQGVTATLREAGLPVGAFDLRVESTVPLGSGLSSSAALLVALLRGLREIFALSVDDTTIAKLAQRAENSLVGAPVGIMDQMVCSLGTPGSALFLDTRARTFDLVPLPDAAEIAVIDSRLPHHHASGEYRIRRSQCEAAAAALGVPLLRDLTPSDLPRIARLPEPLSRRARHVVLENARVVSAVDALRGSDLSTFGGLMNASHASLRDDFEVSVRAIDRLVSAAQTAPYAYGARITGGGFGGSIVILTAVGHARAVAIDVCREAEGEGWCQPAPVVPVSQLSPSHPSIP